MSTVTTVSNVVDVQKRHQTLPNYAVLTFWTDENDIITISIPDARWDDVLSKINHKENVGE